MSNNESNPKEIAYQEDLSIFWKAASFLFPFVGIITYIIHKRKGAQLKAKSAMIASVAGIILGVLNLLMLDYFGLS